MTMLEKLEAVKQVQDYVDEINDKLERVICHTYDPDCVEVARFTIDDGTIDVRYIYNFYGELVRSNVKIPVAWLDEDFDYVTAYKKLLDAK